MFTIRRGKRTDCVALQALLFPEDSGELSKAAARHWRRLAQDPAHDFYVAERDGTLWGMLLVSYVRALRNPGWQAVLDTAVLQTASPDIGRALLRFAKERARKRPWPLATMRGAAPGGGAPTSSPSVPMIATAVWRGCGGCPLSNSAGTDCSRSVAGGLLPLAVEPARLCLRKV